MDYKAFTAKFNGITREIITDVGISMDKIDDGGRCEDEPPVRGRFHLFSPFTFLSLYSEMRRAYSLPVGKSEESKNR